MRRMKKGRRERKTDGEGWRAREAGGKGRERTDKRNEVWKGGWERGWDRLIPAPYLCQAGIEFCYIISSSQTHVYSIPFH